MASRRSAGTARSSTAWSTAFTSPVGLLDAPVPLAVPFLAEGTAGAVGMIAALAASATVVHVRRLAADDALVLADAMGVSRQPTAYGGHRGGAGGHLAVCVVPGRA